jgi:hypothetical protein
MGLAVPIALPVRLRTTSPRTVSRLGKRLKRR